jgi:hypothetical protein
MSIPLSMIEEKRRSLAFLESLTDPSDTVMRMIREFRAEIAAHEERFADIRAGRSPKR